MIRIRSMEWSDYLFVVLAMCGECEKDMLVSFSSNAPYMRKSINSLISKKWIRQAKSDKGKILRLTSKGYNILETLPPLKKHYDGITNNNHKQSDAGTLSRRKGIARVTCECIKAGYAVNNLLIEKDISKGKKPAPSTAPDYTNADIQINEPITTGLPNTKLIYEKKSDIREIDSGIISSTVSISEIGFVTSNIIKALNRGTVQSQINRSRMRGAITGRHLIYATYFQEGPLQFRKPDEVVVTDALRQITQKAYGEEQSQSYYRENPKGEAVLFMKKASDILNILSGEWIIGGTYLDDVYNHVYVNTNTESLKMITTAGWKVNLLEKIYRKNEIEKITKEGLSGYCDAYVNNEMMSTEIISMDLNKIKRSIRNLDNGMKMHIICTRPQEELARSIYENHIENTVIEPVRI